MSRQWQGQQLHWLHIFFLSGGRPESDLEASFFGHQLASSRGGREIESRAGMCGTTRRQLLSGAARDVVVQQPAATRHQGGAASKTATWRPSSRRTSGMTCLLCSISTECA